MMGKWRCVRSLLMAATRYQTSLVVCVIKKIGLCQNPKICKNICNSLGYCKHLHVVVFSSKRLILWHLSHLHRFRNVFSLNQCQQSYKAAKVFKGACCGIWRLCIRSAVISHLSVTTYTAKLIPCELKEQLQMAWATFSFTNKFSSRTGEHC